MEHEFEDETFSNLTRCFVCQEMIENELVNGIWQPLKQWIPMGGENIDKVVPKGEGCSCVNCGMNVHKRCVDLVDTLNAKCAYVEHDFKLKSYTPFSTMCSACGTTLEGLYKQGYRCAACGIDVHPGCRTNPTIHTCEAKVVRAPREVQPQVLGAAKSKVFEEEEEEVETPPEVNEAERVRLLKEEAEAQLMREAEKLQVAFDRKSVEYLGIELRKIHAQSRALSVAKAEDWENNIRPKLKAYKRQLMKLKKQVNRSLERNESQLGKVSRAHEKHYRSLLGGLSFLSSDDVENTMEAYSRGKGREAEMVVHLVEMARTKGSKKEKQKLEKEQRSGPHVKGQLAELKREKRQLEQEYAIINASLQQVNRDVFFPRYKDWFARLSIDDRYVALGSLALERAVGALAVRCTMIPHRKKDGLLVPTVVIAICGTETPVDMSQMGMPGSRDNQRHKSGTEGAKIVAKIESFSVSGGKMALYLDDVSLDLEYFLNLEMNYVSADEAKDGVGYWKLNQNTFRLKFIKFGLKFRNIGSVSLPDSVLRNVIRNLVTSGIKNLAKAVVPPELGVYLIKINETQRKLRKFGNQDQFRFYAKMDVTAELSLESLGFNFAKAMGSGKKMQDRVKKFVGGKKDAEEVENLAKVCRALGLNSTQLEQLLRTQEALGLTQDTTFPDDSLKALGQQAFQALNVQGAIQSQDVSQINLDSAKILEVAQRIGQKAFAGDFTKTDGSAVPLRNLFSLIRYINTYFKKSKTTYTTGTVFAPRIIALWQSALDKTAKSMGMDRPMSMRSNASHMSISSTRSLLKRISTASNILSGQGGGKVRGVNIKRLIERIHRVNQKRMISGIEIVEWDIKVGVRGLCEVAKARMLDANSKRRGGSALLFELKHSNDDSLSIGEEEEEEELEDSFKELTQDEEGQAVQKKSSVVRKKKQSVSYDNVDEEELWEIIKKSTSGDIAKEKEAKEQQILKDFARVDEDVIYVRDKIIKSLQVQASLSIGQGQYEALIEQIDLVSRLDFTAFLSAQIFSHRNKTPNWRWRRFVRTTEEGMEVSTVQVLQRRTRKSPEKVSDPESIEALHAFFSTITSQLLSNAPASRNRVFGMKVVPKIPEGGSSWSSAGKLKVTFDGPDLEFESKMDLVKLNGGLEMLHKYAHDLLAHYSQTMLQPREEALAKLVLTTIMKYALLNTFLGNTAMNLQVETDDGELYFRVSESEAQANKVPLSYQVEHDFVGFTDDLAHILRSFRMEDIPLDSESRS